MSLPTQGDNTQLDTVQSYVYRGTESGTHLLLLGGVHGNEICGQHALIDLKKELDSGALRLSKGTLTIVPYANPRACAASCRYLEENLNRVIKHHATPIAYEEKLGAQIAALIDSCDVTVDIHSTSTYCPSPFVFNMYPAPENDKLCYALGGEFVVKNWLEMLDEHATHLFSATNIYAHQSGKTATVIECGQHDETSSLQVAARAVRNAMKLYGLIPGEVEPPNIKGDIVAKKAYVKKAEGRMLSPDWHHLMPVKEGTVIAQYDHGEKLVIPQDGYLLLPAHYATVGDEWFYFGRLENTPTTTLTT